MVAPQNPPRDPIPESFATLEEAGAFWDTHSTADYEDEMTDVEVEVDLTSSRVYCAIDREKAGKLRDLARHEGISVEELLDRWLREKLAAA